MDNFFSTEQNTDNGIKFEDLNYNPKEYYRQIFVEAAESIRVEIEKFKPNNPCTICTVKDCKIEKKDIFSDYPVGCKYRDWQNQVLAFLNSDYKQKLKAVYKTMMDKKQEYQCCRCDACCKFSTSEFSYTQLKQRAMRGNKFAEEFVSIYEPFKDEQEAREANPLLFDAMNDLVKDLKIYYYHCKKYDNGCTCYENRPDICKNYPNNPLKILPPSCSFNAWKEEVNKQSQLLKAKTDIMEFYKSKLG